jgi:broad specificity phosphatase PhoE
MKILFVRHGESEDDLLNAYGGWADFELTENGINQLQTSAEKIKNLNLKFDLILSSPLKRAEKSAEIINDKLRINLEIYEYLKERNKYGILSGMIKDIAAQKYPEQVQKYNNDEWVDASEKIEDFNDRVRKAIDYIKARDEKNIIVVTHGGFLKSMANSLLSADLIKKEDGGMILIEISNEIVEIRLEDGVEIK